MSRLMLFLVLTIPALSNWVERQQRGEKLLLEGKADQALVELKAALAEADPDAKGVLLNSLGMAEYRAGHYWEAKKRFEMSARFFDADPRKRGVALVNAGQADQALGEYTHAGEMFREALRLMPREAMIWQNLGQVLYLQKRFPDAVVAQHTALSLASPQMMASIWSDLAILHDAQGDRPKAVEMMRRAASAAASGQARARMLANLGGLLWKTKDKEGAMAQFRLALAEMESAVGAQHPDVAKILEDYREVLKKMRKKVEAAEVAERAAAIRSAFAVQTNANRVSVDWRDLK